MKTQSEKDKKNTAPVSKTGSKVIANPVSQEKMDKEHSKEFIDNRSESNHLGKIINKSLSTTSQLHVIQMVRVQIGMDLDEVLSGGDIQRLKNLLCSTYGGSNLSHRAHGSSRNQQFTVRAIINDYLNARVGAARTTAATAINLAWSVTEFA